MGSWSRLKRTEGQRRPCESPTAENLATLQSQFPKDGGAVIRSPNMVMRQRLIRTVRKTVNQDSGKDVSAWAPGRPPIEAESAGQQTAGCHPRRQKKAPQWQTRRQGAHITNKQLFSGLPTLSDRVAARRMKLAGNCHRHQELPASKLLWEPKPG